MSVKQKAPRRKYLPYIICILALILIFPSKAYRKVVGIIDGEEEPTPVRCAIAIKDHEGFSFSTGYNYEMLQRAAKLLDWDVSIGLCDDSAEALDSLSSGGLDLAVLPEKDSVLSVRDGFYCCNTLEDSTVWVIKKGGKMSLDKINKSLSSIRLGHDYAEITERFSAKYEPFSRAAKGRKYKNASPYDSLLVKASAELGWDWRILAALVWQESRFHIEAKSRKGASGLMQMMPSTSLFYTGSAETLNPEVNLKAATEYLLKLQKMFAPYAADKEELLRFTLAAYNAGEGRILDCINFAKSQGLEGSRWEELKTVIPLMQDNGIIDSTGVRLGAFKGLETLAYIERTDSLYRAFLKIKP